MRTLRIALLLVACSPKVSVTVPPVADAGFDRVVDVGATVQLDAARSRNAAGTADGLTYEWSIVVRPRASNAATDRADRATASFIADVAGTYIVQLRVLERRVSYER